MSMCRSDQIQGHVYTTNISWFQTGSVVVASNTWEGHALGRILVFDQNISWPNVKHLMWGTFMGRMGFIFLLSWCPWYIFMIINSLLHWYPAFFSAMETGGLITVFQYFIHFSCRGSRPVESKHHFFNQTTWLTQFVCVCRQNRLNVKTKVASPPKWPLLFAFWQKLG